MKLILVIYWVRKLHYHAGLVWPARGDLFWLTPAGVAMCNKYCFLLFSVFKRIKKVM